MTFKGPLLFVVTLFFCAGFFFSFVVTGLLGENTDYPIAFMVRNLKSIFWGSLTINRSA
ncbi:Uncharacterised protein [Serratia ficaria]|nr:Uncharacterised protein [Serratia ficaria]